MTNHKNMIDELLNDTSDTMNDWELGFIEDMARLDQDDADHLSPNRKTTIEKIWGKVFG